jgi:hypothetical protein
LKKTIQISENKINHDLSRLWIAFGYIPIERRFVCNSLIGLAPLLPLFYSGNVAMENACRAARAFR